MPIHLHRRRRSAIVSAGTGVPASIASPLAALQCLRRVRLQQIVQRRWSVISAHHIATWADVPAPHARHVVLYALRLQTRHAVPWADAAIARQRHAVPWADAATARQRHAVPWADAATARQRHAVPWADAATARQRHAVPWAIRSAASARHAVAYALMLRNPAALRHVAGYALLANASLQTFAATPDLQWHGRAIAMTHASLSCDEDSPVWMASITLAHAAEFAPIQIGDTLTLTLWLEVFVLAVDGKTLSRSASADGQIDVRYELSCTSPLALLDAPFASTAAVSYLSAVPASSAVQALLGPVTWALPDWVIPAGRLQFDAVTPLAAARAIVAAIGGLIESAPDGSVTARARHPVSVPDYGAAAPAHTFADADDVHSITAVTAPARGFNRITIANDDASSAAGSADVVQYVAATDDPTQGTVRAVLASARQVLLTHTGHPATVISARGAVTRQEAEVVEFVEGRANTSYRVDSITSSIWQHTDLGAVSASDTDLVATTPGYSLLSINYATTAIEWHVALAAAQEEVQFVLIDA